MKIALLFLALFFCALHGTALRAQTNAGDRASLADRASSDSCRTCPAPGGVAKGGFMDLYFDNAPPFENCTSIERKIVTKYDKPIQALDVHYERNGLCLDTTVEMEHVTSIGYGGLGLSGNPVEARVAPARELFRSHSPLRPPASFFDVTPFIGYGGKDTTARKIGFASVYYGVEALIAPFGTLLGDNFALAFAGSILEEGGRTRFPLGGNLRWTIFGSSHATESQEFIPNSCKFGFPGEQADTVPAGYTEVPSLGRAPDSTVFYMHEQTITMSPFRAYLYAEGGTVLNSNFSGAGENPSANPDDYSQYYLGIGGGVLLGKWLTASLGYRYMRLNLRTPCAFCPGDVFIQNTDQSNSVLLKIGVNIGY